MRRRRSTSRTSAVTTSTLRQGCGGDRAARSRSISIAVRAAARAASRRGQHARSGADFEERDRRAPAQSPRRPCRPRQARGNADRSASSASARRHRHQLARRHRLAAPELLLDLLDLLLAHPEIVAELVDDGFARRSRGSRRRRRRPPRSAPGRSRSGPAGCCRSPSRARGAACPDTGRTGYRGGSISISAEQLGDGSSSTTTATLRISSAKSPRDELSASSTRRSKPCGSSRFPAGAGRLRSGRATCVLLDGRRAAGATALR